MIPLRQMFRKVTARLINRILDYVLGPIPQQTAPAARVPEPVAAQKIAPAKRKASVTPEPRLKYAAQSAPAALPQQGEPHNPQADSSTPRRAASGATAELPLAKAKPALRPLDHNIEHEGTVWIPRVLWALAWADLNNAGASTASDLTRILEEQAGLAVRANNFARAFRDLKTDSRAKGLWTAEDKRFTITPEGKALLHEIIG